MVESNPKKSFRWRSVLNLLFVIVGLFVCYKLSVDTVKGSIARLFSAVAIGQSRVDPADTAVRMYPADPEAHYTRALMLVNANRLEEAVTELREATRLRPHHYYQWLDLGVTLDRVGDQAGSVAALKESVRLAPKFAQPRWQLGNLFFRLGQYQEAFAELRVAAKSNPNLFQALMGLAWAAADGDVKTFETLVEPDTRERHFLIASFLANQRKGPEAARQIKEGGEPAERWERDIVNEAIVRLFLAEQFSDAWVAWSATHKVSAGDPTQGQLLNGNFTDPIIPDDPGFGWQVVTNPEVSISIDPAGPGSNTRSVSLQFGGVDSGRQLIEQLVLLQPNSRYSLTFMAKNEELISGGPPVINVVAIRNKTYRILAQSGPLLPGTRDWSAYNVDFSTDENTSAVNVALQRLPCSQNPCPIFGKLWLGSFSLTKVAGPPR
jgi:hypothetical protein